MHIDYRYKNGKGRAVVKIMNKCSKTLLIKDNVY